MQLPLKENNTFRVAELDYPQRIVIKIISINDTLAKKPKGFVTRPVCELVRNVWPYTNTVTIYNEFVWPPNKVWYGSAVTESPQICSGVFLPVDP